MPVDGRDAVVLALVAMAVCMALLADLLVLPALIVRFRPHVSLK